MEPVFVGGVLPVPDHVLELGKAAAHMVEDAVQYDTDPVLMQLSAYLSEILVGSQPNIDLFVIPCIISMGIRFKQGAEINRIDPQFLHMRNPLRHLADPVKRHLLLRVILIRIGSSAESQCINLIKNAVFSPHIKSS